MTDSSFKLIYANRPAGRILNFPGESADAALVQERIQSILQAKHYSAKTPQTVFSSGRREYVCRPFLLEVPESKSRQPTVALLLERYPREPVRVSETTKRFHLSPRESEAVHHLVRGLTTKEVAQRMNVSPNTIKQYIRFVMSKMGVTTRTGILGKILSS